MPMRYIAEGMLESLLLRSACLFLGRLLELVADNCRQWCPQLANLGKRKESKATKHKNKYYKKFFHKLVWLFWPKVIDMESDANCKVLSALLIWRPIVELPLMFVSLRTVSVAGSF